MENILVKNDKPGLGKWFPAQLTFCPSKVIYLVKLVNHVIHKQSINKMRKK